MVKREISKVKYERWEVKCESKKGKYEMRKVKCEIWVIKIGMWG
jgi:hypothetical protein|tara:strand:+ start:161274 stop:161405 length:132 start_codon:yes stop_codon:yes gene_type:complete